MIIIKNNTAAVVSLTDPGYTKSIPANGQVTVSAQEFPKLKTALQFMSLLMDNPVTPTLSVMVGSAVLVAEDGVAYIFSQVKDSTVTVSPTPITVSPSPVNPPAINVTPNNTIDPSILDPNNRVKVSVTNDPHGTTHKAGGTDEFNVNGMLGVLNDPQHPISSEVISAMGTKNNTNPMNHDRFNQSEISALPESQLSLNNPTHSNANDLSTAQKGGIDASNNLSSSNPVVTTSDLTNYSQVTHGHTTLPTQSQFDAISNSNSPSTTNPFATVVDLLNAGVMSIEVNHTNLFARTGDAIGKKVYVLDDTTIGGFLYEAGWYTKESTGTGTNSSDWLFHNNRVNHTHNWTDISKLGSKLSDISDIPSFPNDNKSYVLSINNGVVSILEDIPPVVKRDFFFTSFNEGDTYANTELEDSRSENKIGNKWSISHAKSMLVLPFNAVLESITVRASNLNVSPELVSPGSMLLELSFNKLISDAVDVASLQFKLGSNITGKKFEYNNTSTVFKSSQTTVLSGSNIFEEGIPHSVIFEHLGSNPGTIEKMRSAIITFKFKEI